MTSSHSRAARVEQPRRSRWPLVLLALAVIIAAWLIFGRPSSKPPPRGPGGIPVAAEAAKRGNMDVTLEALGTVTPVYTVTVASRVAGELTQVAYHEGQMVKKGDLLAIVDPRPYQAALLQAQGALAKDQANLENALVDLKRYEDAFKQHAIPQQQLAAQQAAVDEDKASITADQGNLAAANVNLAYTRIVSPIDGRVGLRQVDPGNIVPADGTAPIVTITQIRPITVVFYLAEDDLGDFAGEGMANAPLRVDALDRDLTKVLATGKLIAIDNQINTSTGTVKGRAQFANTHSELFPNQFVNVRVHIKTLQGVTLIPTAAIQRNGDASFVYVIVGGKAQSRAIKIIDTERDSTAVTGVNPGDLLVTDGFDRLQNGTAVQVRPPAGAAAGKHPSPSPGS